MDPEEALELFQTVRDIWEDAQYGDGEWHSLSSSNVYAFRYLPAVKALTVEYKGGTYTYFNIDTETVHALATASSPGAYANANLKGRTASNVG